MCKDGECVGPCYDLCMCSHCWRGWNLPFTARLKERVKYILRIGY